MPTAADAPTTPLVSPSPLFVTGQLVTTPGALDALARTQTELMALLERHVRLDPGNLEREDQTENRWGVMHGLRILSEYILSDGTKVWLITEADRSVTKLLLPEEY